VAGAAVVAEEVEEVDMATWEGWCYRGEARQPRRQRGGAQMVGREENLNLWYHVENHHTPNVGGEPFIYSAN